MLRQMRKYRMWLMAAFGILLMLTWLGGPALERAGRAAANRVVARLDDRPVRAEEMHLAAREVAALDTLFPFLIRNVIGVEDRGGVHWLLLVEEARAGEFIAHAGDGAESLEPLAQEQARAELITLLQSGRLSLPSGGHEAWIQDRTARIVESAERVFGQQHLSRPQMHEALAKMRGVVRMIESYASLVRVSDRRAIGWAREQGDAALANVLVLPGDALAASIGEPDAAALAEHFHRFRDVRPGEGEYGVGYRLPRRVKLEWVMLDRSALEAGAPLDDVETRKYYDQHRDRYPGEYAAERANVERALRAAVADRLMQDAHVVVQAQVRQATRRLEREGGYLRLPDDWETHRPRPETIAAAIVEQVRYPGPDRSPIPTPHIHPPTGWLTESALAAHERLGTTWARVGTTVVPAPLVIFSAREFGTAADALPVSVQARVPLADVFLTDAQGNRYYVTILDTRPDSPPDTLDEVADQVREDWRCLRAYEQLLARTDELKSAAIREGLEAAAEAFVHLAPPDTPRPTVHQGVRVSRPFATLAELNRDADARRAVMEHAQRLDPLRTSEPPPDESTLALPSPRNRALLIVRVRAYRPISREDYWMLDATATRMAATDDPAGLTPARAFSLRALLERHRYVSGERPIRTPEDLRRQEVPAGET